MVKRKAYISCTRGGCLNITEFEHIEHTYFMDVIMIKCSADTLFCAVIFQRSFFWFSFASALIQLTTKTGKITSQKYKSLNKSKLYQFISFGLCAIHCRIHKIVKSILKGQCSYSSEVIFLALQMTMKLKITIISYEASRKPLEKIF